MFKEKLQMCVRSTDLWIAWIELTSVPSKSKIQHLYIMVSIPFHSYTPVFSTKYIIAQFPLFDQYPYIPFPRQGMHLTPIRPHAILLP